MLGSAKDFRFFQSSDGTQTKLEIPILGIGQMSAAAAQNKMELTYHAESSVGGYEFITKNDWNDFAVDVAELAIQMVKADAPKAGTYPIIADP
jgi:predicted Zn-dependent protease